MELGIIGTGNVSFQLATSFFKSGHNIVGIYGRNVPQCEILVKKTKSKVISNISDFPKDIDVLIIAVSDNAIEIVSSQISPNFGGIVVHTSGAMSMETIKGKYNNKGVLYPLYSFPSKRKINLSNVPFLVSAISIENLKKLSTLAHSVSSLVRTITDEQRLHLHLAAVYANNFANFIMTNSFDIVKEQNLDIEVLFPIIKQSSKKWSKGKAKEIQTGPAKRGDMKTEQKHLDMLSRKENKQLYQLISQQIKKYYS